jgi:predicted alpha/beta superfamily hydrolase
MVEFVVRVPDTTPHWTRVFLAGDGPVLGHWSAHGYGLDRWHDDTHRARLDVPAGGRYLVTLGRWRDAESDGRGGERPARELAAGSHVIEAAVAGWGRNSVRYHHDFPSKFLPRPRTLTVYVPSGYDLEPGRRYPVFYLHDGQNLFDAETSFAGVSWGCDETAERLIRNGEIPPVILVGVGNTADRLREYGAKRAGRERTGDWSRDYGRFLVEEVKPFIDRDYRTLPGREHTAVGGSSMGGLISLNLCKWYPGVFGLCGALSPSLWWDGESFLRAVGEKPGWLNTVKVWLDMGGREGGSRSTQRAGVQRARRLADALRGFGLERAGRLRYAEDPHAGHNEQAWAGRFGDVLRFLFTPPTA